MNILIVGNGGREHALAWKVAQSELVSQVYVAPGNAGTALEPGVRNIDINPTDIDTLLQYSRENAIDLCIVGPEAPLVMGIVDTFMQANIPCFGPSKAAAQLEGSKAFSKDFLSRHNIPTAWYGNFTEIDPAIAFIRSKGAPIVVKADGLAAGKGVILAHSEDEAIAAVKDMLAGNTFGDAGSRVVIEEFLVGEEASFICMVDGKSVLPMASSQDHKARDEGDLGPNTGGMGAYSPAPVVTAAMHEKIIATVINPTVQGMLDDGQPFTGFLYAGVMIGKDGIPKVLEFNVRFGDPETQPIMMRLQSDLVSLIMASIEQRLDEVTAQWDSRSALGVVVATRHYPHDYPAGEVIHGLNQTDDESQTKVFHAGTALNNDYVLTSGGRVLCVVGMGDSVKQAADNAYARTLDIDWEGAFYRKDIGHRAIQREQDQTTTQTFI